MTILNRWNGWAVLMLALLTGWSGTVVVGGDRPERPAPPDRSPFAVIVSPDGGSIYAADRTSRTLVKIRVSERAAVDELPLQGIPVAAVLAPGGERLYVAEQGAAGVAVIDLAAWKVESRIPVKRTPTALAVSGDGRRLFVADRNEHGVAVFDVARSPAASIAWLPATREPSSMALTHDGKRLVVANLLPLGRGTDPDLAAAVDLFDTVTMKRLSSVKLPTGSTMAQGICVSPDGRWAYVVHGLGRFSSPITQLERGWVNTYAMSVIDIAGATRRATVLLDELTQGAADPHSIVCSSDGKRLWISHTGVHEVSRIDVEQLHRLLGGDVPAQLAAIKDGLRDNIWVQIKADRSKIAELENDLTALYLAGLIRRWPTNGRGPKGIALSPDNSQVVVANYYSGTVSIMEAASGRGAAVIPVGDQPPPTAIRRGEMIFHDATFAFQRWHSCASCHANAGRVDGLRWDFLADGIGNGKDTMSLVFFDRTEPLNRRATVARSRDCVRGGLESTNGLAAKQEDVDSLYAYLTSLRPEPSPHLTKEGELSESAKRGKQLFEGRAGCARCHPAPYFTDKKMHNVGVLSSNEPDGKYDTPSLIEAYRTAPYLHDGRALTIDEVLTRHNAAGRHGKVKELSEQELRDLVEYVLSL